ncbi:MAG: DNA polymerase III subunit gamma/tau [Planctomycetota bacterium]
MSYLVLARKYRPRAFADVVGQEVAMATLRGAIQENRVGHAYLFSGPRGTGKTTSARILARALNCERGPTIEPCGECIRCTEADRGADINLIEIDAASNRGIDAIRDLLSTVDSRPMHARFKVYILDEAHMLTKEASNALLKVLEEPPSHVKFFLATTEPEKLLVTIRSRCQMVQLVPLSERAIADRLTWVFGREGITPGPGVADEIAKRANGGMRDALSMADQLLSLVGSEPVQADVERLAGDGGNETLDELFERVERKDAAGVLAALASIDGGQDEFLDRLLAHVRACLVAAICGPRTPVLVADDATRARLAERGERVGAARLQIWLEELLGARERMRLLPGQAQLALELVLLDLCRPEADVSLTEIERRLGALAERLDGTAAPGAVRANPRATPAATASVVVPHRAPARPSPDPATSAPRDAVPAPAKSRAAASQAVEAPRSTPPPAARASGGSARDETDAWERFLGSLQSASLAEVLRARGRMSAIEDGRVRVRLVDVRPDERLLLREPRNVKACSAAMSKVLGRACEVVLEDDAPAPAPARDTQDMFTGQVSDLFAGRIEDEG